MWTFKALHEQDRSFRNAGVPEITEDAMGSAGHKRIGDRETLRGEGASEKYTKRK